MQKMIEEGRTSQEQIESIAIWTALFCGAVLALVILLVTGRGVELPLGNELISVAAFALYAGLFVGLFITPIMYLLGGSMRNAALPAAQRHNYWWSVAPVTIAITLLLAFLITLIFDRADSSFVGVTLRGSTAAITLGILIGLLTYLTAVISARMPAPGLLYVVLAYLFGTLFYATTSQSNLHWWQRSFSYLGMSESSTTYIFDVGIIFTAILVLIWQQFFMDSFTILYARDLVTQNAVRIIRAILIFLGIGLAGVGLVRFGENPLLNVIHDVCATGGVLAVVVLMLIIYWLNPHYIRAFYILSGMMVLTLVSVGILKTVGLANLVGLELLGFVLAGLWLLLFTHHTTLLLNNHQLLSRPVNRSES